MFYYSGIQLQHRSCLFACLSSGWATTTGRLLGLKAGNSLSFFSEKYIEQSNTYYKSTIYTVSPASHQKLKALMVWTE